MVSYSCCVAVSATMHRFTQAEAHGFSRFFCVRTALDVNMLLCVTQRDERSGVVLVWPVRGSGGFGQERTWITGKCSQVRDSFTFSTRVFISHRRSRTVA